MKFLAMLIGMLSASAATACDLEWTSLGPTPLAPEYIPQGLSHDEDGLILSLYSKTEEPRVRFFRYDGTWDEIKGTTAPLRHTSGIVPYRDKFFLIDYETGFVARARIDQNTLDIEKIYETGHTNISAGMIFNFDDADVLAISRFGLSKPYIFITVDDLLHAKEASITGLTQGSATFVQGNFSDETYIMQTRNRLGRDVVEWSKRSRQFPDEYTYKSTFPGKMIEDITMVGDDIYTTDERLFQIFKGTGVKDCE